MQEGAAEDVTILLLGNKSDHAKRQIKFQEGEVLAKVSVALQPLTLLARLLVSEYNTDYETCPKDSSFTSTGVQL